MKSRLALSVLAMMSLTFAAKVPNDTVVDSGSFGVYVNGTRVATETCNVEQAAYGANGHGRFQRQREDFDQGERSRVQRISSAFGRQRLVDLHERSAEGRSYRLRIGWPGGRARLRESHHCDRVI